MVSIMRPYRWRTTMRSTIRPMMPTTSGDSTSIANQMSMPAWMLAIVV